MECFRLAGIQFLRDRKITLTGTYRLAKPYNSSNIHIGWLSQKDCELVTKMAEENWKGKRPIMKEESLKFEKSSRVDKILMIKPPKYLRSCSPAEQCEALIDSKRETTFAGDNNFFFLVKWHGQPSSESTWEDEFLIRKHCWDEIMEYFYWRRMDMELLTARSLKAKLKLLYPYKLTTTIAKSFYN